VIVDADGDGDVDGQPLDVVVSRRRRPERSTSKSFDNVDVDQKKLIIKDRY